MRWPLQPVLEGVPSQSPVPGQAGPSVAKPAVRNVAVDAYRGLVMVLMMAEVLHLAHVASLSGKLGMERSWL